MITLKTNTNELVYIDKENEFLVRLYVELKQFGITILPIEDKYSSVDFIITKNDKVLYLELKSRKYGDEFKSFIIGRVKLENIKLYYKNTILIWNFPNELYYKVFTEDLLKLPIHFLKNSKICYITKEDTVKSFNSLVEYIVEYFK